MTTKAHDPAARTAPSVSSARLEETSVAAAHTGVTSINREEVIRMARDTGQTEWNGTHSDGSNTFISATFHIDQLERFASLVAAAKQEECAKVCEEVGPKEYPAKLVADGFAAAIRALK